MSDNGYEIGIACKGGQKVGGGGQNKQFKDLVNLIDQSPRRGFAGKELACIYISGDFWTRIRDTTYLGYEKLISGKFNLIDLLRKLASDKKCIILSDNDLPETKSSFYKTFIEGKLE
jgi:hypothetical protein